MASALPSTMLKLCAARWLVFFLALTATVRRSDAYRPSCAQHEYSETQSADAARLIQRAAQRSIVANHRMFNGAVFDARIDVVFTVIHDGDKGKVSRDIVESQLAILQEGFNRRDADSGFTFTLGDVVYEDHSYWHGNCHKSNVATTLKQRFSKNVSTTLNVIVCGPTSGILGFASFPSDAPEDSYRHAIVLNYATMPGADVSDDIIEFFRPFTMGITLVHEAGHYFGLAHTFNSNSCDGDNDAISDTPVEKSPAAGCPVGRDSCTAHPGHDPVRNFMDYSDDSCMSDGFTVMQMDMMREQVTEYRPTLLTRGAGGTGEGPSDCGSAGLFASFRLEILADQFPADISWRLIKGSDVVAEGDMFRDVEPFETRTWTENELCVGNYELRIHDSFADGLCCSAGNGEYRVFVNGQKIGGNGDFGAEDEVKFTIGGDDLLPAQSSGQATSPPQAPTPPLTPSQSSPPTTSQPPANAGGSPAAPPDQQQPTSPESAGGNSPAAADAGVTGCALLTVRLRTDDFPEESSWAIFPDGSVDEVAGGAPGDVNATRLDSDGVPIAADPVVTAQSGGVADRNVLFEWKACLSEATKYKWILRDSYGDGICCNNGAGSFQLHVNDNVIFDGDGVFDDQFIHFFDVLPGDISSLSSAAPLSPGFGPDAVSMPSPQPQQPLPPPPQQQQPSGCAPFIVRVLTDDFPEESSWALFPNGGADAVSSGVTSGNDTAAIRFDTSGNEITAPGGGAADRNIIFQWNTCLNTPGNYSWVMKDSFGDGICCSNGEGSYQLLLRNNVIVQGDGVFEGESSHTFEIQPSDLVVASPVADAVSPDSDANPPPTSADNGGGNDAPPPLSCSEQVDSLPPAAPLVCYADTGRAAVGDKVVLNESPLVDLGCFPVHGHGDGLSVESVEGSAFGFISDQVRSVATAGNKDTQMLEVRDAVALSPGSSDFTVMLWVKLAPNATPGDVWIAAHGNSFRTVIGWAIRASGQSLSFRVNDGKSFGRRIMRNIHDGDWHHLAMVVDRSGSGLMHGYLDGSEQLEITLPGAGSFQDDKVSEGGRIDIAEAAPLTLGIRVKEDGTTFDRAMKGALDGFAIYHSALSRDAVAAIFEGRGTNGDNVASSVCPIAGFVPPPQQQPSSPQQQPSSPQQEPPSPQQQPPSPQQQSTGQSDTGGNSSDSPSTSSAPVATAPTDTHVSGGNGGSNADPCRCSSDGFSGAAFTDVIGCSIKTFFADLCYVQEPTECVEAFPSTNFAGAAYRRCDNDGEP